MGKKSDAVEATEPSVARAQKLAPRDLQNDPAWLRHLLGELLAVLPNPIEFRAGVSKKKAAEILGYVAHATEGQEPVGSDEEESE